MYHNLISSSNVLNKKITFQNNINDNVEICKQIKENKSDIRKLKKCVNHSLINKNKFQSHIGNLVSYEHILKRKNEGNFEKHGLELKKKKNNASKDIIWEDLPGAFKIISEED